MKSVTSLQCIRFWQLTRPEKTEISNVGRATPAVLVSSSSSSNMQTNPAIYANIHQLLSGCAESKALLRLLIKH